MIDIISEELLNIKDIENILFDLNITTAYVCKIIRRKEDLREFTLPKTKKIIFKKAYLLDDCSIVSSIKEKDCLILLDGGDLKKNTLAISNKSQASLFNPIGTELCFDQGLAEIAKQNNKTVYFNINEIRTNQYRAIKQMNFIINLLKQKNIDIKLVTMAKRTNELIDERILESFLINFNLEKEISIKILNKEN